MGVPEYRYENRATIEQILDDAPNVTVTIVNFFDLIATPIDVFTTLAANGWPIIAETAAATIDPTLYRNA
jgi:hypothetical protein